MIEILEVEVYDDGLDELDLIQLHTAEAKLI